MGIYIRIDLYHLLSVTLSDNRPRGYLIVAGAIICKAPSG